LELINKSAVARTKTDWIGADERVLEMQSFPDFASGEMIAYRPVPRHANQNEVLVIECIFRDKKWRKNPYHLGNIHHTFGGGVYDAIEREYQLSHPGWWMINEPSKDKVAYLQWRPWIFMNDDAKKEFLEWHADHFAGWSKEKWKANKHTWKKEESPIILKAPVIVDQEPEQLTLCRRKKRHKEMNTWIV